MRTIDQISLKIHQWLNIQSINVHQHASRPQGLINHSSCESVGQSHRLRNHLPKSLLGKWVGLHIMGVVEARVRNRLALFRCIDGKASNIIVPAIDEFDRDRS